MFNVQQLIAIDVEGGKKNLPEHPFITVALVSSAYKTLYIGENIPLNSNEFRKMHSEVKRIIASNVVVAHGVDNDLDQVGLKGQPGLRYADTAGLGNVGNKHEAVHDAKKHMEFAIANFGKLGVQTYPSKL